MVYKSSEDSHFITDEYIKFSNFDSLYDDFNRIDLADKNNFCCMTKYLLATIVGCIEGNIEIDIKNNTWYFWLSQYNVNCTIVDNSENNYMLISICDFIKNNIEFYDHIIMYYNLWHTLNKNDNPEFVYDKYHMLDLKENFQKLIYIINRDLNKAKCNMDDRVIETYKFLYGSLMMLFDKSLLVC